MKGSSVLSFYIFGIALTLGQVPVPMKPIGYVYNKGIPTASVQIEFYIDILCHNSRTVFPVLLEVADYYGPSVQLSSIPFPVPYHRNAWLAAKGIHVVRNLTNGDLTKVYGWIQAVFNHMEEFGEDINFLKPEQDTVGIFANIADTFGLPANTFSDMLVNDKQIDYNTRIEWKYACTRGIAGTPWFTVNGVLVTADQTWTVDDWKSLIDPLLLSSTASPLVSVTLILTYGFCAFAFQYFFLN